MLLIGVLSACDTLSFEVVSAGGAAVFGYHLQICGIGVDGTLAMRPVAFRFRPEVFAGDEMETAEDHGKLGGPVARISVERYH